MRFFLFLMVFSFLSIPIHAQPEGTPFIAWSPDGSKLAVGQGTEVQILDSETLTPLMVISDLNEQQAEPAWRPDGTRLAIANGLDVEIWNVETASRLSTYQYYSPDMAPETLVNVTAVLWSPDGKSIAATVAAIIFIWDVETGVKTYELSGEWGWITHSAWVSENQILIAEEGAYVEMIDVTSGDSLWILLTGIGEFGIPYITAFDYQPINEQILVGRDTGRVTVWEEPGDDPYQNEVGAMDMGDIEMESYPTSLDWQPTGDYIVGGSGDGTIRIWDAELGYQQNILLVGRDVDIRSVRWSPDGHKLAYGTPDGNIEFVSPVCTVTTRFGVNLRRGPGENFDADGSAAVDQPLAATGQVAGNDGFIWWRVPGGRWVREDLVLEDEYCRLLPSVDIENSIAAQIARVCNVTVLSRSVLYYIPSVDSEETYVSNSGEILQAQFTFFNENAFWYGTTKGWIKSDLVSAEEDCNRIPGADVYQAFPDSGSGPDTCELTADQDLNIRRDPNSESRIVATLTTGQTEYAEGYYTSEDGFIWWRVYVAENGWIREDLVTEAQDCFDLPQLEWQFTPDVTATPYMTPTPAASSCQITAQRDINLRFEPRPDAAKIGKLHAGESKTVDARHPDADFDTWWRLTSGEWVRQDLVEADENCRLLPVIETP